MTEIKQALYTVAVIAVSAGIFNLFTQSSTLKKYTKYALSLTITISLLYPLTALGDNLPNLFSEIDVPQNTLTTPQDDYLISALKQSITEEISNYFQIPTDVFESEVMTSIHPDEILIDSIHIKITDKSYYRYAERIEYYLKSTFGCQIKVTQEAK